MDDGIAAAIHEFNRRCPDWLLTFAPLRERAVVIRDAHHVVLVDGTLDAHDMEVQVRHATEAILRPELPHPSVVMVDR